MTALAAPSLWIPRQMRILPSLDAMMALVVRDGKLLTLNGKLSTNPNCCCDDDPCASHPCLHVGLPCNRCECTPNCIRVLFSGITGCTGCFGEGASSTRISFINGFDPNDEFDLTYETVFGCSWQLLIPNAVRAEFFFDIDGNSNCDGEPDSTTDYDVTIRVIRQLNAALDEVYYTEMRVTPNIGPLENGVIFASETVVAEGYCGDFSGTNLLGQCLQQEGTPVNPLALTIGTGGSVSATICCPEE